MTIKIERETKWNLSANETKTTYYVWTDLTCVASFKSEQEAIDVVNGIKSSSYKIGSEIIFEETI